MPRPPRRKGESEAKYFVRVQAAYKKEKEAGKTKPTPQQQHAAEAARRREGLMKKLPKKPRTGLQALQSALTPKPEEKK